MRLKRIIPGIVVILFANAIALIGVALNRGGEPFETMRLTERELSLERAQDQDNSGISLKLNWVCNLSDTSAGFDRKKLLELGFDCPPIGQDRDNVRVPLPKVVFAALEYEGQTWTEWMSKRAEQPSTQKTANPDLATRLFVVDTAKTAAELRIKFPDTRRYLIVQGMVRAVLATNLNPGLNVAPEWRGYVVEILPSEVHVPLPLASALARLDPKPGKAPRYTVALCYGRHFEPWISAMELLRK